MPAEPSIPSMPAAGEVHLWTVPCADGRATSDELLPYLSERERQRTLRMTDDIARAAFVIGRARVRQILGQYVSQPPAALDVVARAEGKPVLDGAPPGFDFSFSRCAQLHVCAVALNRRVGVDVEMIGFGPDADVIASKYFTEDERAWLATRPSDARATAFAAVWVKKEAFVKAIGTGLRLPLTAFHVPLADDGWIARSPSPAVAETDAERWRVRTFRPAPLAGEPTKVVGAVVAAGDWRLTMIPWPGLPAPHAR